MQEEYNENDVYLEPAVEVSSSAVISADEKGAAVDVIICVSGC